MVYLLVWEAQPAHLFRALHTKWLSTEVAIHKIVTLPCTVQSSPVVRPVRFARSRALPQLNGLELVDARMA